MAVGVILFTFIKANHDTDHFHPNLNQLVRILTQETDELDQSKWATAPLPLADQMEGNSLIGKTVKVRLPGKFNLQTERGDVPIDIKFSEPSFFEVFGFKLLSGNVQSLETNPTSLFLTEKTAKKIFGYTDVIGQTVQFENIGSYTVVGIIQDPPLETHLPIEAMASLKAAELLEKKGTIETSSQNWEDFKSSAIYARLKSADDIKQLNSTLQHYNRKLDQSNLQFLAQRVEDITPRKIDIKNDPNAGVDWMGIKIQLFLILSLTLLSAFNYISLTLARAFSRAQEVGIRKTVGASRGEIIGQFLMESCLISLLALFFTIPCVLFLMEFFPEMEIAFSWDATLILVLLTYAVITGMVAGAFPSWLLSAFQPIQILRKMKNIKLFRGVAIYKVFIVLQFSVTIMLMILVVTLVDYERKNNKIISAVVPPTILTLDLKGQKYENLKNRINQLSQVESTLATNWYYEPIQTGKSNIRLDDKNLEINYVSIDPKTIENEGIILKSGKNFPSTMPQSSEQYVLVNEEAAKLLDSDSDPILGKNLLLDSTYVQVIGIMPNEVIGKPIPLVYRYLPDEINTLIIKITPTTEPEATQAIQALWNSSFPEKTANIHNLRERYTGAGSWERISFFGFFALIIMIIAGLGILGIASYSVETRTKELGMRKILGANKIKLVWTVSRNFGILILISGLIGVPLGWFGADLLRKDMGNLVELNILNFSLGFGLVSVLGLLTVFSQTIRAGQIEPIKALKVE